MICASDTPHEAALQQGGLCRGLLRVIDGCDDGLCATDGMPLTADAPLQRGELAKSAMGRHAFQPSLTCCLHLKPRTCLGEIAAEAYGLGNSPQSAYPRLPAALRQGSVARLAPKHRTPRDHKSGELSARSN